MVALKEQVDHRSSSMGQLGVTFLRLSTQFENLGDALIVRELLRLVQAHSELVIDVSSAPATFVDEVMGGVDPERVTLLRHGAALSFIRLAARARRVGRRCYYLFLPAGITGEKTGVGVVSYSLVTSMVKLLKSLGVHPIHLGASYSDLGQNNIKLVRARAAILDHHIVRDRGSETYLRALSINVDGTVPDMSFGLYPAALPIGERNTAAFSFRLDRGDLLLANIEHQVRKVIQAAPGMKFKFVSQVRRDDGPMFELSKRIGRDFGERVSFYAPMTIKSCIDLYANVSIIFSNRLHALLLAAYAGSTPVACVDQRHDKKIIRLFTDLGWHNLLRLDNAAFEMPTYEAIDRSQLNAVAQNLRTAVADVYGSAPAGQL